MTLTNEVLFSRVEKFIITSSLLHNNVATEGGWVVTTNTIPHHQRMTQEWEIS